MKTFFSAFFVAIFLSASTLHAQEKGALGVTMSDNKPGGTLVTSVLAGSPAAKIGLQAGDRILTINGQKTDNYRDVERVTAAHKPGDKVELMIIRGAWKAKLTATLGPKDAVFTPAPKTVATPKPIHTPEDPNYGPPGWYGLDFSNPDAAGAYGGGGY
jgi:predicted metalloprotease with PDZ domain